MITDLKKKIEFLETFAKDSRKERLNSVLNDRTRWIMPVTEDVCDMGNVSAVMRSAECYGIQEISVVSGKSFRPHTRIVAGAGKWQTVNEYDFDNGNGIETCVKELKSRGYQFAVTSLRPDKPVIPLHEVSIDKPLAICFGNEHAGTSDKAHELADFYVQIPMFGFTESFNISVGAAVCMYELTTRLRNSEINWHIEGEEREQIYYRWLRNSIKRVDDILEKHGYETEREEE